jgi:hypothetical protein
LRTPPHALRIDHHASRITRHTFSQNPVVNPNIDAGLRLAINTAQVSPRVLLLLLLLLLLILMATTPLPSIA